MEFEKFFNQANISQFSENSYDCITINNFMYFWESNPQKLLKMYKELYKLIRIGGTIRIFPVFYGNYYCDNVELFDFLNSHFSIQCLRPNKDYSKESPIYLENQENGIENYFNGLHFGGSRPLPELFDNFY